MCLCYGNDLYGENAKKVYGAVGCPPIFTEEEKTAWKKYVQATVEHYKDRVLYYEIWNEPDGEWCWKHGVNGTELGEFTLATAKTIKESNPLAKTIGGAICLRPIAFLNQAFSTGMGKYLDFISFHEYTHDETLVFERVKALRSLPQKYNPNIKIIQGESGSQSKRGGQGALKTGAWTQEKQAKQLARHTVADLLTNVYFTSYFSCMDMIEALNGSTGDKASYLDFAYFGVLGADFDQDGKSVGEYTPKKSYYVLQNIASVFSGEFELYEFPCVFTPTYSTGLYEFEDDRRNVISGGFKRESGELFALWKPTNIMTTNYEHTVSFEIYSEYDCVRLIDVMDGSIYELPNEIVTRDEFGTYRFNHLPIKDTPMLLEFGKFLEK